MGRSRAGCGGVVLDWGIFSEVGVVLGNNYMQVAKKDNMSKSY